MIFGSRNTPAPTPGYFMILLGQSNADGRIEVTRLQNTLYNYQGIGLGYPATRVAEPQYVVEPSGVYTYFKSGTNTSDFSPDDGVWQAYEAAVNSSYDDAAFGSEVACAQRLQSHLNGADVHIVKVAFGGTGLSSTCTTSTQPYNWNPTIRYMASAFWIQRALRDFRTANPTIRPRLLCVNWWQGEQDAIDSVPEATYEAQFATFRTYMTKVIYGLFVDQNYVWNLARLDFNRTPEEAAINDAIDDIAATYPLTYVVDSTPYPQDDELTEPEWEPLPLGMPNADGGFDNNHKSYIGMVGVGELMADNVPAAGII